MLGPSPPHYTTTGGLGSQSQSGIGFTVIAESSPIASTTVAAIIVFVSGRASGERLGGKKDSPG